MKDLTQGSLFSHVLYMAASLFAGLVVVLLCGLIDLFFVADLGEAAIAGVGAAGNAGFLVSASFPLLWDNYQHVVLFQGSHHLGQLDAL